MERSRPLAQKAADLAGDDRARHEYARRVKQFEKRQPLRVTPGEGK